MGEVQAYEEILEFAISREVQANLFYRALAESVTDQNIRLLFESLAKEELGHKAKLELELLKVGRSLPKQEPEEDFEISDYIIGDANLEMNYRDVLTLAIEKEDASFQLYVDLVAAAKDKESKDVLLSLAQEEVKHKLRFEYELKKL